MAVKFDSQSDDSLRGPYSVCASNYLKLMTEVREGGGGRPHCQLSGDF